MSFTRTMRALSISSPRIAKDEIEEIARADKGLRLFNNYHLGKANMVANTLSRKERLKRLVSKE